MTSSKKFKRRQERSFSAHHLLINTAEQAEVRTRGNPNVPMCEALGAITFSALAIEALCNSIGDRMVQDWNDFESASPIAKLRILCIELGVEYKATSEPWVTARFLMKFRNKVVHAKPERVIKEDVYPEIEHEKRMFDIPESKVEKDLTSENAQRALETVQLIKELLLKQIPIDKSHGLPNDAWSGRVTLDDEA